MAKATKKQALGRGLSALLNDPSNDIVSANDKNADKVVGNIVELELATIVVNPFQPRTSFNAKNLESFSLLLCENWILTNISWSAENAVFVLQK